VGVDLRRARAADVENLALGLKEMGIQRGDKVAILSENRYEWPIADLAILSLAAVTFRSTRRSPPSSARTSSSTRRRGAAFTSTPAQTAKLRSVTGRLPMLRSLIPMDAGGPLAAADCPYERVMARGAGARRARAGRARAHGADARARRGGDRHLHLGTTGEPKGAMLTHENIVFDVDACMRVVTLLPSDLSLSFLPLCHIFERMAGLYAMLRGGATIAYAESMDTVGANAVEVRPTILNGVPRFYEKVYARVMENALARPGLRKSLFQWGIAVGSAAARARFAGRTPPPLTALQARLADRIVGAKVRERMGGRLRFCISGGAPLATEIMEFFFAIGITVLEGYGLTETSPVICLNRPGHERPGSVGLPIPGVEVRIGAEGEILTRGRHVMKGYFKNEEATRAAVRDGWFHTGDVGHLEADGALTITDRLKDLLVTAGGKKVAPQPLELKLKASPWIAEAVLLGDRRPYVVCLIVPDFAALEAEAAARGWAFAGRDELIHRPEVPGAVCCGDRAPERGPGAVREGEEVRPAAARADAGDRGADAVAQGEAACDQPEVFGHHRAVVRLRGRGRRCIAHPLPRGDPSR
jgi:long-chain acyl-CoA synthetase